MTISLAFLAPEQKRNFFCLPESPISKPRNGPLPLEIQVPGTEFLDAERPELAISNDAPASRSVETAGANVTLIGRSLLYFQGGATRCWLFKCNGEFK